jgi:hypothetical protein
VTQARTARKKSRAQATRNLMNVGSVHAYWASVEDRERRYYQRQALIDAPADAKKRIKALIQMGPPDADEAARLVAEFEGRRSVTRCPVMACAEIRNGDGFA